MLKGFVYQVKRQAAMFEQYSYASVRPYRDKQS